MNTTNLRRADELKQHAHELRSEPTARLVSDRASALDTVTWARLLQQRAEDATAPEDQRLAARKALEGVGL